MSKHIFIVDENGLTIMRRKAYMTKHGLSQSREYTVWLDMRRRCNDSTRQDYKYYGGRGIRVCERWASFECFVADMGKCPHDYTLERKEKDGNYEPLNCVWASRAQQTANRHTQENEIVLSLNDRAQTISAWAKEIGMKRATLYARILAGWTVERALTRKVTKNTQI